MTIRKIIKAYQCNIICQDNLIITQQHSEPHHTTARNNCNGNSGSHANQTQVNTTTMSTKPVDTKTKSTSSGHTTALPKQKYANQSQSKVLTTHLANISSKS